MASGRIPVLDGSEELADGARKQCVVDRLTLLECYFGRSQIELCAGRKKNFADNGVVAHGVTLKLRATSAY